jgi:hypothetical protein
MIVLRLAMAMQIMFASIKQTEYCLVIVSWEK